MNERAPGPGKADGAGILAGIRVLDFGRYIAGPYCAALLAEYGADVVRIEKRQGSEDRWATPVTPDGDGALFLQMNRNKRSLTLDPMHARAAPVMRGLIERADVVVANLPLATRERMGLDYPTLSAINPRIVLVTCSMFGSDGPWSERVGFDGLGQAMSSAVYMAGEPGHPTRAQAPYVDFGTALHCAFGTLLALMNRERTGRGQEVEGTLLATALTISNASLIEQAMLGLDRKPSGNRGQTAAPVNVYPTRDGWVMCQVIGQPLFARWARLMGEPHWLTDPRFASDEARGNNAEPIDERMRAWCGARDTDTVLGILADAKIPAAPVLTQREALEHPATRALGLFEPLEPPGGGRAAPVARVPLTLSATPGAIRHGARRLGADSDAVLAEIGLSPAEIATLRADGVV